MIGTIELGGLIASQLNLSGAFWDWFENININTLGFIIVGMFVATRTIGTLDLALRPPRRTLEHPRHQQDAVTMP